jgi:hypothetical protein
MSLAHLLDPGIITLGRFPVGVILLDLLLSFVLGVGVATLYSLTHRGIGYSRNMVHNLVLLAMIVTMVMLVVGDSVARAFGLVGALAIIRFRSVVRDTRDMTFLFLSITVGIAVGAQQYLVALVGTVVVCVVAASLGFTGFGTKYTDTGVLRVRASGPVAVAIDKVLDKWCRAHALVAVREGSAGESSEYNYEIRLFHPREREDLLSAVRAIQGASQVTVAIEEKDDAW